MFAIPKCDNSKESELMSLKKAVQAAELHKSSASEKADLRGYMALTDSILHFIMYAQPCCGVSEVQVNTVYCTGFHPEFWPWRGN